MFSISTNCLICSVRKNIQQLHYYPILNYREDYIRLGVSENATKEEIKTAYINKAKMLHPDIQGTKMSDHDFAELNESYQRLLYEHKYGSDSYDKTDPRNDPRRKEYWEIRTRHRTTDDIDVEEALNGRGRDKEKKLIRNSLYGKASCKTNSSYILLTSDLPT